MSFLIQAPQMLRTPWQDSELQGQERAICPMTKLQGQKQQQCWVKISKEAFKTEGQRGSVRPCGLVWCNGSRGRALAFFSCPKALQISSDSTLLWLRPSAKATTERI